MSTRAGCTLLFSQLTASAHTFLNSAEEDSGKSFETKVLKKRSRGKCQDAFFRQSHVAYPINSFHTVAFAIFMPAYFA